MAAGGEQGNDDVGGGLGVGEDLYAVLGLKKECSAADLRIAYKKLALRWHPDRCSAQGSSKTVEEAKTKFQAIQEAYSVLSDTNKRFMYDVGVYDDDNDDAAAAAAAADGMGDFLSEMAAMMSQANHNPCDQSGGETFEQLQELFVEMFQADMDAYGGGGETTATASWRVHGGGDVGCDHPSTSSATFFSDTAAASFYGSCRAADGGGLKRDSADMCSGKAKGVATDSDGAGGLGPGSAFCFGTNGRNSSSTAAANGRAAAGKRRNGRKPKASSRHDGGPSPQTAGETQAVE